MNGGAPALEFFGASPTFHVSQSVPFNLLAAAASTTFMTNNMMNTRLLTSARVLACISLVLGLAACGSLRMTSSVSKNISEEGVPAEVVFPDITTTRLPAGTRPNPENLRMVSPGATKDQVIALLGMPHFSEGLFGVREWDYVFQLPTAQANLFMTCRYKVVFDKNYLVGSTYWLPADCAKIIVAQPSLERVVERIVTQPVSAEKVVERQAPLPRRTVDLSADVLFAFNKSSQADLLPAGRNQLDSLAKELINTQVDRLVVVGHADRLGGSAYNLQLSQARAATVLAYLRERGVNPRTGQASGRGETEPQVACEQQDHNALVACLAPNRRVSVAVVALEKQR